MFIFLKKKLNIFSKKFKFEYSLKNLKNHRIMFTLNKINFITHNI